MKNVTSDLSQFGFREKDIAADLLKTHGSHKDKTRYLDNSVTIQFNIYSGCVFLCDINYNTAMLNDSGELEDFHICPECGGEGIASEFREQNENDCCQSYADDLGLE